MCWQHSINWLNATCMPMVIHCPWQSLQAQYPCGCKGMHGLTPEPQSAFPFLNLPLRMTLTFPCPLREQTAAAAAAGGLFCVQRFWSNHPSATARPNAFSERCQQNDKPGHYCRMALTGTADHARSTTCADFVRYSANQRAIFLRAAARRTAASPTPCRNLTVPYRCACCLQTSEN